MRNTFVLLLLIALISCKKSEKKEVQRKEKPEINRLQKHTIKTALEQSSKQTIDAWKEYTIVEENLKKFTSISANEALNNAIQLTKSVKKMKDSIRPKELINPSFRTRINVLENEALRLKDMTLIPAITASEINQQVDKIMEAFSAANSKINTVYSQLNVEKEIQNSTKKRTDNTRKRIELRKKEERP